MVDSDLLGRIFTVPAAAWTATLAFVAYLIRNRNERLRDLNTEKAGDWDRIRSERDVAREERDLVRDRWAQCEAERLEWMARAVRAEAIIQGYGEARQLQAIEDAQKRVAGANGNGGGDA